MKHDDIAQFLAQHPDFFEQHPELLAGLNVPHPQNGHAISLVERQSMILRNRITALEARIAEMARHGEENDVIADKLVHWSRTLLLEPDARALPDTLLRELLSIFNVPHGALRLWDVQDAYRDLACAQEVSEDVKRLASSMVAPFCGSNVGFEAAEWMNAADSAAAIQSLAMLPLRVGAKPAAFGLLVLGSPDKDRFHISMGTAFLTRIAELASAALTRLAPH